MFFSVLYIYIYTVAIFNGVYAAVCDTGLWFCLGSLRSQRRPSPSSSPASTAGPSETDTQPRHGVSLATVQGLSPWAALAAIFRLSPMIRQQCVSHITHAIYVQVFGKFQRRFFFSVNYVNRGGHCFEEVFPAAKFQFHLWCVCTGGVQGEQESGWIRKII